MMGKLGRTIFAACCLVLLSGHVTWATDIGALKQRVASGDPDALTKLAVAYQDGKGVKQDYVKARKLLEKAAALNFAKAQSNLGAMLVSGEGGPKDIGRGVQLYEKAADGGIHSAAYNLALLLEEGKRVPQNISKAIKFYKVAAEHPTYTWPQYRLGEIYRLGKMGSPNLQQAIHWYREAAKRGYSHAQYRLALLLLSEYPSDRSNAQAFVLLTAAENAGHKKAKTHARKLKNKMNLHFGLQDKKQIYTLLNMDPRNMVSTALEFIQDSGGRPKNLSLTKLYFDLALAKDEAVGYFGLGAYHLLQETSADNAKAEDYFKKAAALKLNAAHYNLAWMHYTGIAQQPSDEKALKYALEAANLVHMLNEEGAMHNQHLSADYADLLVSAMYLNGRGTSLKPDRATVILSWLIGNQRRRAGSNYGDSYIHANAQKLFMSSQLKDRQSFQASELSDEGRFFHKQGSPTPTNFKMSALVGEISATWEYCKHTKLATDIRKTILKKLKRTVDQGGRDKLVARIKRAYERHKKDLRLNWTAEMCPSTDAAKEMTETLLEYTDYDWGLQKLTGQLGASTIIYGRVLTVGEFAPNKAIDTFEAEPLLTLRVGAGT